MLPRPDDGDYAPFYQSYIDHVPDGNILDTLEENTKMFRAKLEGFTPDQWSYAYREGKWTVKDMVVHLIDTERIMAYRALRVARGDNTPLPGFDQDQYVLNAYVENRSIPSILEEFDSVRSATMTLFNSLVDPAWYKRGKASGHTITVLALAFIIVGHINHHMGVLKEKYEL